MQKESLFSTRVSGGGRTYFFDVNKTAKGSPYITINESKKKDDKFESSRIFIFEEQIAEFKQALDEAVSKVQ